MARGAVADASSWPGPTGARTLSQPRRPAAMSTVNRAIDRLLASGLARMRRRAERHVCRVVLARCAEVGEGTVIRGRVRFTGAQHARLGANVIINDNANVRAEAGLTIGANTHISRNLVL